ncbi:cordon-bleu (predicted), isoform CRA_a [Rattus norvegicus]|uniref:Protein cordon-bleu n=1 Tax=Rattus norvegicus TaxID=10116 RepID=COBL_RAT|nr:RecName: Full=Protein cordon-bleu [Rattus norvegicus]EDL76073.1 cordon-bleu (predicted), isoform CRA_a [Rattus norvegicus]|eukprot:NP_001100706.1 protein cordon-bleu [Rattus norvegicus]
MKARAPPPPGKPAAQNVHSEQKLPHDATLGSQQSLVHLKEALHNSTLDITVVLPSGLEKQSVVSGSRAVMDLLVELCLQNHLNPSHHVLEIWSSETQQPLSFKPNTLIGSLNAHTVFLKEKVPEEKGKPGLTKAPEKSVRLVVNYLRTQKAVMRVSPEVPLQNILPVICAKCEVSPDHVVLLRDNIAGEELELSKSLNELGIKELYAWDNRREMLRKSSLGNDETDKEKKKFLGFFKVNKRSNSKAEHLGLSGADSDEDPSKSASGGDLNGCVTTPNSPSLHSRSLTLGPSLSLGNISGMSMKSDMKKRRAPPPPSPGLLGQDKVSEKASLSSQADLQKKKRRAPAPPPPQPPPPSPVVPNRKEDKEENRKSTVGMEENYETDTSSLTSSVNGVSNHSLQEAIIPDSGVDDIPVTFIGEVSDEPFDSGLFFSGSNNAAALNQGGIASQRSHLPPYQTEQSQPFIRTNRKEPDPSLPSQDYRKRNQPILANTSENENPVGIDPRVTSFVSKPSTDDPKAKDKDKMCGSGPSEKTQTGHRVNSLPVNPRVGEDENSNSALPPWSHHGQASGGSYGLKYGLTTYKIVPPKPEMRCYDRDVSLSTGAIKIDELGNLMSPHMNGSRTISKPSAVAETEAPPIGKVKEFWRRNSMEKYLNGPAECTVKKAPSTTITATSEKPQRDETKAGFTLTTPEQQPASQEYGAPPEEDRSRPHSAVSCPVKVPAPNPTDITFLKPQRRTSSQYVASAIAKKMGPPKVHADVVRPHKKTAEQGHEEAKLARPPPAWKDSAVPNLCSEAGQCEHGTNQGSVRLPSNPGGQLPADHPKVEVNSTYGKSATHNSPAAVHRNSYFLPGRSSQRDRVSVGQSCGFHEKQTISNQKMNSTSNPSQALDKAHPAPLLLTEARDSGRILVNGSAQTPGNCEPPHSQKESTLTSYIILQTEEKPSPLSADGQNSDDALPSSIFGPKKKFKPVVQRPLPKDISLHSALMEAIHTSGGRDKLRKTAEQASEGRPKKPSYVEAESERSALLAAIRGHSGTLSLRKVSSLASEELQSFRDAALMAPGVDKPQQEDRGLPPPPALPPPSTPASQVPSASIPVSRFSIGTLSNPVNARQALMDAIRSGTGAARLRKVPLLV